MSWLADSSEMVSGWLSSAYAGHGILGSALPSSGDNGGSPVLNDGISAGSEYRWALVTAPTSGTLSMYEDCTFSYDNTDGVNSFVYRLYEDGADQGTATVLLQIGPSATTIAVVTADAVAVVASGSGAAPTVSCSITATASNAIGTIACAGYVAPMALTTADINAIVAAIFAQAAVTPIQSAAQNTTAIADAVLNRVIP